MGSGESKLDRAPVVMFVDDNEVLQEAIERLLRFEGYKVLLASNGEDALEKLELADPLPAVIISDVMMPVMDGFKLFEKVRERREWLDIQFLFLTARDQLADLERAYDLGADDYLVKPFEHDRLLLIVSGKIKRRQEWRGFLDEQQQALDKAKGDLVSLVAHELRTPLVPITMVTDILTRELDLLDNEQIRQMVETMQSGSARLNRLIEQIVMFVQLRSGALTVGIQDRVRLNQYRDLVISGVMRARQFSVRQNDIPVRFEELTHDLPICGDMMALQHGIAEVLANAMTFSPPEGEVVARLWKGEGLAWFAATDQGPGIAEDELELVFDPFYQANREFQEQQGVGIGLTLARGIVQAHGGVIELQSTLGHGTEVRVGLPIRCNDDD